MPKDQQKTQNTQKSTSQELQQAVVRGGIAGSTGIAVIHPLMLLKYLAQPAKGENKANHPLMKWIVAAKMMDLQSMQSGFYPAIRSLYKGFLPNVASVTPITTIQVTVGTGLTTYLNRFSGMSNDQKKLLAGAAAGVVSTAVAGPVEFTLAQQQRYNTMNEAQQSFWQVLRHNVNKYGVGCLKTGFWGTAGRDSVFACVMFAGTNLLKEKVKYKVKNEQVADTLSTMLAGAGVAGLTQPIDAAKTRQTKNYPVKKNIVKTGYDIVKEEGLRKLWAGGTWRAFYIAVFLKTIGVARKKCDEYQQHQEIKQRLK